MKGRPTTISPRLTVIVGGRQWRGRPTAISPGLAVLVRGRSRWRGRIGFAVECVKRHRWRVQFGADGPAAYITEHNLRPARRSEVVEAGMYGVGFKIIDE